MKRVWLVAILVLTLAAETCAQDDERVVLPDTVMKQVVSRMIRWYFKPSRKLTTIYFSDKNLKKAWLPEIRGVRFIVLDSNETQGDRRGYVIDDLTRTKRGYLTGLGYGDIGCGGKGEGRSWTFRVSSDRVIGLRPDGGGFDWICSSDSLGQ